ncbi:Inorganic diphosphatase [Pyrobaculum neutrophilum V24Sta]|uniref:Inorganic pyrophosphatase n=2 Tax=Pyrobaculum neutrophilum TaxID=70771 RepID=B1YD18_PYRNV|nr:Inorganic diphosphatase [Pyrobaculum neutrophilum V24Sta]
MPKDPGMKAGKNPPEDIYVFIEIPKGSNIKYEFDEEMRAIVVDRILYTAMFYPFNYGYIPETLEEDGDPLDCLVVTHETLLPGVVIRARPIGVLITEDEEGVDRKIIAVPHEKVDPRFAGVRDVKDLPESVLSQIKHFFEHYKELEPGKWVKVKEFKGREEALKIISEAVSRKKNK